MAEKTGDALKVTETAFSSTDCLGESDSDLTELASLDPYEALSELEAVWEDQYELSLEKIKCPKRKRHIEFIPIRQFNIDHLDDPYKDPSIVELVHKMAALTVRLQVSKFSSIRPQPPYPPEERVKPNGESRIIRGTGFVDNAYVFTEESGKLCPCIECKKSAIPKTRWGQINVKTAGHVVHDYYEAEETVCYFNFDEDNTDVSSIPSLVGSRDSVGVCTLRDDQFKVIFYTHNVEFAEQLSKLVSRFTVHQQVLVRKYYGNSETPVPDVNFYHKVIDLFSDRANVQILHQALDHFGGMLNKRVQENCPIAPNSTPTDCNLVIVVSHPHGCGKYVSLGRFRTRKTISDDFNPTGKVLNWLTSSFYLYTTHTCQGSSGAPVFILSKERIGKVSTQIHSKFLAKFGLSRSGYSLDI
ncbi:unnamed protein product [Candidula unifasciata]|uniref:Uncharacterized protein n=1 Tax=Candidula unifasciata TaxID=100452 RepID=A0A8S3ZQM7_9EUPU|nr:unnamed protein product [Candidula unifasciata]